MASLRTLTPFSADRMSFTIAKFYQRQLDHEIRIASFSLPFLNSLTSLAAVVGLLTASINF